LEAGVAADGVLLVVHVRELETMRLGSRAKVPDPGTPVAGHQRVTLALVEGPVADLGRGGVPDVGGREEKDGTEVVLLQHLPHASEAVLPQPLEVDADLPVDPHHTRGRRGGNGELTHCCPFPPAPSPGPGHSPDRSSPCGSDTNDDRAAVVLRSPASGRPRPRSGAGTPGRIRRRPRRWHRPRARSPARRTARGPSARGTGRPPRAGGRGARRSHPGRTGP